MAIPISMTRFVAANIYAPSAAAAEAPCLKKFFAVATALYEHDEDMKPKKVPYPNSSGLWPSSSFETVSVDTQASTPPAIAKPTTKAHQVIQAIVTAVLAVSIVPLTRYSPSGWLVVTAPMTIASTAIPLRIAYPRRSRRETACGETPSSAATSAISARFGTVKYPISSASCAGRAVIIDPHYCGFICTYDLSAAA